MLAITVRLQVAVAGCVRLANARQLEPSETCVPYPFSDCAGEIERIRMARFDHRILELSLRIHARE
jgi:hypothetical protein